MSELLPTLGITNRSFPEIEQKVHKETGIDITKWWDDHKKVDRQRLENELSKYSTREIEIIKKIIKGK